MKSSRRRHNVQAGVGSGPAFQLLGSRWRSYGLVLILISVGVLVLAACGSTSKPAASSSTAAAPKFTGSPIKIGEIAPSGTTAVNWDPAIAAVRAAIAGINARGGINGHQVIFDWCNEGEDPNIAANCARKMVSDGVVATVGDYTQYGDAVTTILNAAHIPELVNIAQSPDQLNDSNVFLTGGSLPGDANAFSAVELGAKRISVIGISVPAVGLLANADKTAIAAAGGEYTGLISVPITTTDFSPYIAAAVAKHAQAAEMLILPSQFEPVIEADYQAGDPIKLLLAANLLTDTVAKQLGPAMNAVVISNSVPPLSDAANVPGMAQFISDMKAEAARGDQYANLSVYDTEGLEAWVEAEAVYKVASTIHGAITASSVMTALNSAKNLNFGGIIPPWTPSSPGPANYTRVSNPNYYTIVYRNGVQVVAKQGEINLETLMPGFS
jgi:ABC-type branched-subunit amino acid transport system substrate-binding protein